MIGEGRDTVVINSRNLVGNSLSLGSIYYRRSKKRGLLSKRCRRRYIFLAATGWSMSWLLLQHTITHCNTPRHTATHRNTPQQTRGRQTSVLPLSCTSMSATQPHIANFICRQGPDLQMMWTHVSATEAHVLVLFLLCLCLQYAHVLICSCPNHPRCEKSHSGSARTCRFPIFSIGRQ